MTSSNHIDEKLMSAFHEAGHVIIGQRIGLDFKKACIYDGGKGHVTPTFLTFLKLAISIHPRGIYYLSGIETEKYFFPSSTHYASHDEDVLQKLTGMFPGTERRMEFEDRVQGYLFNPSVREQIIRLASRLMIEKEVRFDA